MFKCIYNFSRKCSSEVCTYIKILYSNYSLRKVVNWMPHWFEPHDAVQIAPRESWVYMNRGPTTQISRELVLQIIWCPIEASYYVCRWFSLLYKFFIFYRQWLLYKTTHFACFSCKGGGGGKWFKMQRKGRKCDRLDQISNPKLKTDKIQPIALIVTTVVRMSVCEGGLAGERNALYIVR